MFDSETPFENDEGIGRAILDKAKQWDPKEKRPASVLFLNQKNGCSVDRVGDRTEDRMIEKLKERFSNSCGVAVLRYDTIISEECSIKASPEEDNLYHCSVFDSDGVNSIPRNKARNLAKHCSHIVLFE